MRISHRSLGVYVPGLREFVPASWSMPENPFLGPGMAGLRDFVAANFTMPPQPAGIGDLVPGSFSVPSVSMMVGLTPPQPSGIGDFVGTAAMYPIPQNSVLAAAGSLAQSGGLSISAGNITSGYTSTDPGAGLSGCAGGVGHECADCKAGRGCHGGMSGLGQITTDLSNMFGNLTSMNWSGAWGNLTTLMGEPVIGTVPVWMIAGGGLLAWALLFSGGEHSRYRRGRKAYDAGRRAYA